MLQLVPRLEGGGVERGTVEIAEAIVQSGGRALVATEGGKMIRRLEAVGGEPILMNAATKHPLNIWQNGRALAKLIRDLDVDIVHARSRAPAWSGWMACRDTGAVFVTTYHGAYTEDFPLKRWYNAVMAKGTPVIAPSEFIRHLVVERHGVDPEDVITIPRGADLRVFSEDRVTAHRTLDLTRSWDLIEDTRPIVMMPGRLTRLKGGESLIDAAARLKELRGASDFLVLLVGGESAAGFSQVLADRIEATGTSDVVRMTGACDDMPAALKLASVVVSASIEPESFGRVAVEAQAMGRPVIATAHGGAMETVEEGVTGWLYPPGDVETLAVIIAEALLLSPKERDRVGRAGRKRVETLFTTLAMQRSTLAVYEGVTGREFPVIL